MRMMLGELIPLSSITSINEALQVNIPISHAKSKVSPPIADLLSDIALHESSIPQSSLEECWCKILQAVENKLEEGIQISNTINNIFDMVQVPQDLLEFLCYQCVQYVIKNPIEEDIPFGVFVAATPVAQFISQRARVEMWIRQILLPKSKVLIINCFHTMTYVFILNIEPKSYRWRVYCEHFFTTTEYCQYSFATFTSICKHSRR